MRQRKQRQSTRTAEPAAGELETCSWDSAPKKEAGSTFLRKVLPASSLCRGRCAVLVEGERQQIGDAVGRPLFDVAAFDHVDDLAVLEQRDRWRRWRETGH